MWQWYNHMQCLYDPVWLKKNKRTTKCDNDIVICNVDIAQCEVRS